jgi:hypothetical protein
LTDARVIEKSWADPEQFAAIFDRYFGQLHRYLAAGSAASWPARPG